MAGTSPDETLDDELCIKQLSDVTLTSNVKTHATVLQSPPVSPGLKRCVTYIEPGSPRVEVSDYSKGLQRRRSESRRHATGRQEQSRDEQHVENSQDFVGLTLVPPPHKLSRDGVHYVSPYPSPSMLEAARLSPVESINVGTSKDLERVDSGNVRASPGRQMAQRTDGVMKDEEGEEGEGYPGYRAAPVHVSDKLEPFRNITDDHKSVVEVVVE